MNLIELHVLQSFPVTCLNRDDLNAPKTAMFGGTMRARVSSQCWKRAIREMAAAELPDAYGGERGHFWSSRLVESLVSKGKDEAEATKAAEAVATFLGDKDAGYSEGHKTKVALYLTPMEIDAIAQAVVDDLEGQGKADPKRGKLKKAISAAMPTDIADIAIFGRMVAKDHTLQLEGAGMFSHALSTHPSSSEIDFFSAVDDLKPEESEGAGHLGTLEYSSACYYRYVALNMDLLLDPDHLGNLEVDSQKAIIRTFLRATLLAVPKARKNSMFGNTAPAYVKGIVRRGQPLSLVNAFEGRLPNGDGYVQPSIEAMDAHHTELRKTYNLEGEEVCMPDNDLDTFCREVTAHAF